MSSGSATTTGPGRPVSAIGEGAGDDLGDAVGVVDLGRPLGQRPEDGAVVDLLERLAARASPVAIWPTKRIIGDESCRAVCTPIAALVAPGPRVTKAMPGRAGQLAPGRGHEGRAALLPVRHQPDAVRRRRGARRAPRGSSRPARRRSSSPPAPAGSPPAAGPRSCASRPPVGETITFPAPMVGRAAPPASARIVRREFAHGSRDGRWRRYLGERWRSIARRACYVRFGVERFVMMELRSCRLPARRRRTGARSAASASIREMSAMACLMQAQPQIAAWSETHPGLRVARFTCRDSATGHPGLTAAIASAQLRAHQRQRRAADDAEGVPSFPPCPAGARMHAQRPRGECSTVRMKTSLSAQSCTIDFGGVTSVKKPSSSARLAMRTGAAILNLVWSATR